ncbi:MAG: hypothetical protein RJQ00_07950 [Vicingaceae bacterium]
MRITKYLFFATLLFLACNTKPKKSLVVTVTAYNSLAYQTKANNPSVAAWGDTLKPGMKTIAVSRDLIDSGLVHNKEVYLEGFEEPFLVKDKLNKRYTKRIDIYMGVDVKKAKEWGKQTLKISWDADDAK